MTEVSVPPDAERDIEHLLRTGKSAQWIATNLGEPMPLVMKVLDRLRKEAPAPDDDEDDETPAAPVAGARPLTSVPPPTTPGSAPSVEALVSAAARSTSKRTKALGQKLDDLANVVRQRLNDERVAAEAAEKVRREREAAAAEVARLEAALKEARAKARPARQGGGSPVRREAKPGSTRGVDLKLPCREGCDRTFPNAQGRGAHEKRTHKGSAA